jgi:transcriptional regulator with XRE-family HTH domain
MADGSGANALELGRYLTQVREKAGLKQAELARMVTWSPAVLSRVESGERPLAHEELAALLSAINTPEARLLKDALGRDWQVLPRPALDHPDQDVLWEAEQVARELSARREDPEVRNAFERRLTALISEIEHNAGLLLKRDYQVAFVGSIGIGKSTAICRVAGLEIPDPEGGASTPVLEAGAGGITICEVHLRAGPGYGLLIEPRAEDEIRADVSDFAEYLTSGEAAGPEDSDRSDNDQQGISKEIERAIRNMAGMKVRREKGPDGRTIRRDEAKELAREVGGVRELIVEILAKMELHRRDRRDVWYDPATGKPPLLWLKDTFEQVNNGRHADFTLPRRIEVVVPGPLLGVTDLSIRILDTKGIDRTAARADLEGHLDDPHTIAVLCSGFNNAPAAETRLLLERACQTGVRSLGTHAALLVLPRTSEALAVKDEAGVRVETVEEGYELKGEQVGLSMQPLGLENMAVEFFNAHQDPPERLRRFLITRLLAARAGVRQRLNDITESARSVLANHEREQVQEVVRQAGRMLRSWTTQNSNRRPLNAHVQDSLMEQIARAYASTIRATVRREGEWANLSYSHHLGFGARRLAAMSLGPAVSGFTDLCKTMAETPDYTEARELISQAERVLSDSYEDLLRKVQIMGQTSFRDALKVDIAFWVECSSEWGQGPGYRNRVAERNARWFAEDPRQELEGQLWAMIDKEWHSALDRVNALFDADAA